MNKKFIPQFFYIFKSRYTFKKFFNDFSAGLIVGIVALPLSIAFAIGSGVKPEQGLYTAVIAGFLISLFSGSKVQIGGPTGAFIVIIYGIVQKYGYDGLVIATVLAGIILIIMGFAKFGSIIKFIPYPVTVGFTSGIAFIIFFSQIKDLLGLSIENVPAEFIEKLLCYIENIKTINYYSVIIGLVSLTILIIWPKITKKIPGSIIAIILMTVIVVFFKIPVETIETRFGNVANTLQIPRFPVINLNIIITLFPSALTIAVLAGIESLLSAVVADGMTGERHNSNMELIAQGIANIASPIFGGIPATGAIARTATNIKNGGKSPLAGIIHSIVLLLIMLFLGRFAKLIPLATLSAILIFVAYNMSEYHFFIKLFRSPKSDIIVLIITFFLTVFIDLTIAIEVGVVLAAFLFMRRMANVSKAGYITNSLESKTIEEEDDNKSIKKRKIPNEVEVFEIYGSFFFGVTEYFKDTLKEIEKNPKVLILRMRNVFSIDATAIRALEDLFYKTKKDGTLLIISGIRSQPLFALQKSGLIDKIGDNNICADIDAALEIANNLISSKNQK